MASGRCHWKFIVRDQFGFAIQNAKVFVYQPGTTTDFLGSAFDAKTGGSAKTNPFTSNNQGEVEAFFVTAQPVDVFVTSNSGTAYRAALGAGSTVSFTSFTEVSEIFVAAEDQAEEDDLLPFSDWAETADLVAITTASQTADGGALTEYARGDHRHAHTDTWSINPHGITDHTDITRKLWLPVNDGVVIDGGTLTTTGAAPDEIRTINLADALTQGAAWSFVFDDWASGALSVQIYWAGTTTMAGNVRFNLQTKLLTSGNDITGAGTAVAFTSATQPTANQLIKETLTSTTITPANGDLLKIGVRRLGADGADTYTGVVILIGIMLSYTAVQ